MKKKAISAALRRFILTSISSIPYLETMLLMRQDQKHSEWTNNQIAERIFISSNDAEELLAKLCEAGIISITVFSPLTYQYQPKSEELKKMIDQLADAYTNNLIEITNLIHAKTDKKAQKFADAFIFKKDT